MDTFTPLAACMPLGDVPVNMMAISFADEYLILGNDETVEVVCLDPPARYPPIDIRGRGGICCVKWSPAKNEFFLALGGGEVYTYRIDDARERYATAKMDALSGVRDGVFSHDGESLVLAVENQVMVWRFVAGAVPQQDSWDCVIRNIQVDVRNLPDAPASGDAKPLRVWWPDWTSDLLYVAYAERGICVYYATGAEAGSIKRYSPTLTAQSGTAIDLHASRDDVLFARACVGTIEIIELNTTVVSSRSVLLAPINNSIMFWRRGVAAFSFSPQPEARSAPPSASLSKSLSAPPDDSQGDPPNHEFSAYIVPVLSGLVLMLVIHGVYWL
ncbi:hypothetical protein GGF50DRAFT_121199 [Schizophyllum commune]